MDWMIYGANGYTGKLMAEEAGCGCGCFGRWRECLSFRCTFY